LNKIYIEPNVINNIRRKGLSGHKFRLALEQNNFIAYFGVHGIYELARGFLDDTNNTDAKINFKILSELDPTFSPPVKTLHEKEIDKFRTEAEVIPILDNLNAIAAKQEVIRLEHGFFDNNAKNFIIKRENDINTNGNIRMYKYLTSAKDELSKRKYNLKTYYDVYKYFEKDIPDLLYKMLDKKITISEAEEISSKLEMFPAINAAVRANIYLCYIPIVHKNIPGKDKYDDYRHLIEGSYCNFIITGDKQLIYTTPLINPFLKAINIEDLFKDLNIE